MSMTERWKDVVGYEGLYRVSNTGRIFSAISNRLLKISPNNHGYLSFKAYRNKIRKAISIHSAVLEAFVGSRPNDMLIRHLDGNKENNDLNNLIYGTPLENAEDAKIHGTVARGEKQGIAIFSDKQVSSIKERLNNGERQSVIAKEHGCSTSTICDIFYHRTYSHVEPAIKIQYKKNGSSFDEEFIIKEIISGVEYKNIAEKLKCSEGTIRYIFKTRTGMTIKEWKREGVHTRRTGGSA